MLGDLGSDERRRRREQVAERLVGVGVPEPLARAHALRPEQRYAPDMVWVAGATGRPIEEVAEVFFEVGAELRLDWMETELERVPATSRMQRWALQAVREDAAQVRRELAGGVLAETDGGTAAEACEALPGRARRRAAALRRASCARSPARASRTSPGLTLAVRQLRALDGVSPQPRSAVPRVLPRDKPPGRDARCPRSSRPRSPRPPPCSPCRPRPSAQVPPPCDTPGPAGTAYATGFNCRTLDLDGVPRRFEVYVPANARRRARRVHVPRRQRHRRAVRCKISGWREEADAAG